MIRFWISETFSFSDFRNVLEHISLPAAGWYSSQKTRRVGI